MRKIFEIKVEIDGSFANTDIKSSFVTSQMLFTDFNNLFDYETLKNNTATCLKKCGKFNMLTVTLMVRNENVYSQEVLSSFRFVDRYAGEIAFSRWNGYSYNDFQPSELKKLNGLLKDLTNKGNSVL